MRCRVCRSTLRARSASETADTVVHEARGLCHRCYAVQRRRGALESFPRVNTLDERRQAFRRDYRGLERLGWSMAEIADGLGMSVNLVRQLRCRYGLSKKQTNRRPPTVLDNEEVTRLRRLVGFA